MRLTRWTLFAAALAVSVYAKEAASTVKDSKCMEPSAVAALETKIGDLQQSNDALQLQIDSQSAVKSQLLTETTNEHNAVVLKLQKEIAVLTKDVKKHEKKTVEKVETELKTALAKLNEETERASSRESDISKLEENLAKERAQLSKTDAELKAALAKLSEETKRATELEKRHQDAEKKNQALMKELGDAKSEELTMVALLSTYYDNALELAEQSVVFAQEKINEQSGTLEQVQSKIEDAKKTACDTTSKFYQENLAATLDPILVDVRKTADPILADVRKAVNPHVERYLPIVQKEATKVKQQAVLYSQETLRRAKLARIEVIALLEQNEHVAAHAQKVIDGVLISLAVPLVLFQIRLALRLVSWLFTTALCVLTCGLCCGTRKRSSTKKRKIVKTTASVNASLNAPVSGSTKKTTNSKVASTAQKRSKKGKN